MASDLLSVFWCDETAPRPTVTALVAGLGLFLAVRLAFILSGGIDRILMFVPDDAFYYFVSADNFARLGSWTFDSGISHTTGFHLLHGYLLAGVSLLFHGHPGNAIVYFAMTVTSLCALAGAALLLTVVRGLYGPVAVFAALPALLSYGFLMGSCSGMEWGVVLLAACLIVFMLARLGDRPAQSGERALLFGLGLLLELGRSDAGLLAGALLAGGLIVGAFRPNRPFIVAATLVLAGALAGLALTLAHCYLLSGEFVSGSARMKALWGQREGGFGLRAGYRLLLITMGVPKDIYGARAAPLIALAALITAVTLRPVLGRWRGRLGEADPTVLNLTAGSVVALAGFTIFYGFNSASTQFWYSSTIIAPVCLLFSGWLTLVARFAGVVARGAALAVWGGLIAYALYSAFLPAWTYQPYFRVAGLYAAQALPDQRIGCWNCGITGFFRDGPTVNLDGLMNDDVYRFVAANDLDSYIQARGIAWLLDYSASVEAGDAQRQGGFDTDRFRAALHAVQTLSPPQPTYLNPSMTLYRLDYAPTGTARP